MDELKTSVLYSGDNLKILRKHIPDNSIDLIYLDPPFGTNRDYTLLYKENNGKPPGARDACGVEMSTITILASMISPVLMFVNGLATSSRFALLMLLVSLTLIRIFLSEAPTVIPFVRTISSGSTAS